MGSPPSRGRAWATGWAPSTQGEEEVAADFELENVLDSRNFPLNHEQPEQSSLSEVQLTRAARDIRCQPWEEEEAAVEAEVKLRAFFCAFLLFLHKT